MICYTQICFLHLRTRIRVMSQRDFIQSRLFAVTVKILSHLQNFSIIEYAVRVGMC